MESQRGVVGELPALQYNLQRSSASGRHLNRCSACCSRLASLLCSNIGVCALVLLYTVAGAFVFTILEGGDLSLQVDPPLEGPKESAVMDSLRQHTRGLRHETVEHLWSITETLNILYRDNWTRVAEQELLKFSEQLVLRLKEPNPEAATTSHTTYQWTFAGSFLYSLTVITTIGEYNHHLIHLSLLILYHFNNIITIGKQGHLSTFFNSIKSITTAISPSSVTLPYVTTTSIITYCSPLPLHHHYTPLIHHPPSPSS